MDFKGYLKVLISYVLYVVSQVMVFNYINVSVLGISPLVHLLFVLMLPFEMLGWVQLLFSFGMGLTMDMFCDTMGINAASCTLMAWLRPMVLKAISPREGYESGQTPYLMCQGVSWYLQYSLILVLCHNTMYFMLDAFGFDNFFQTMLKIIFTTIFSLIFHVIVQFVFYRKD